MSALPEGVRQPGEARPNPGMPPAHTAVPPLTAALLAVLGSEDLLFRDPFADFIPSGR